MKQDVCRTGYPSIDRPWLQYYTKEAADAELPKCTMYEYILERNRENFNRVALSYYDSDMTYGEMFDRISHMAGVLEAEGVCEGDVVTICMINGPDTVCLLFALNKIGAVANMVYGTGSIRELKKQLLDAKSEFVFTLDIYQEKFLDIAEEVGLRKVIVTNLTEEMSPMNRMGAYTLKGMQPLPLPEDVRFCAWTRFFEGKRGDSRTCHNADAAAVITYTGGTTGGAKGAVLSNKAIISVPHQVILRGDVKRDQLWMQVLPLFIAYGVTTSLLIPLAVGMKQIIRIPMTETIAEFYKMFKPNIIVYSPAYWEKFADDNEDLDLSDLILPTSGGDALRLSVEEKINAYLQRQGCPNPIMNGYGMTEVGAAVAVSFSRRTYRPGSAGVPFVKTVIAAFDPETGKELPFGQEGEICIQAPSAMLGYINAPEETEAILQRHDDGKLWVHSGDLGYMDEDGFLFVSGRMKRYFMYVHDGVHKKIFSLDIERVLLRHPAVDNCAVVPILNPETMQVPVAYVICKEGAGEAGKVEAELRKIAERCLEGGYLPVKYIFIEKFPLTRIGKVDYRELERRANSQ